MYGIFTYIYHTNQLNVGKYTIHGSYGDLNLAISCLFSLLIGRTHLQVMRFQRLNPSRRGKDGGMDRMVADVCHINEHLGGGFKHFLFSPPNLREMIQFDEHIFQMGWFNHQLDILYFIVHTRDSGRPVKDPNVLRGGT